MLYLESYVFSHIWTHDFDMDREWIITVTVDLSTGLMNMDISLILFLLKHTPQAFSESQKNTSPR